MKKLLVILAAISFISMAMVSSCTPQADNEEEEQIDPKDLKDLVYYVPVTDNWVWDKRPQITIHVENPNKAKVKVEARVTFSTDKKKVLGVVKEDVEIPAKSQKDIVLSSEEDLDPGFYRASCAINGSSATWDGKHGTFVFGISPLKLESKPDKQPDFDKFWADAITQLKAIPATPVNKIPLRDGARKVYLVELQSVPNGLTGTPETIRGYYLEPQDGKQHPVIMHFFGYDTRDISNLGVLDCPLGTESNYAEFYLSHRGQYINNRNANQRFEDGLGDLVNQYGDWFAFQFGDRDGYYYRGAFLDCVQAIRFMAEQPTTNKDLIFAEGTSQGGALSYAAAALSTDYPLAAIAPGVSFLGDFPDYFEIVTWPGDTAKKQQQEKGLTDAQMYAFLSYFDMKNLATRINCPVISYLGLQDGTCPPHTNMAPFNNLGTSAGERQMFYYPQLTHDIPKEWGGKYMKFFNEIVNSRK